MGKSLLVGRALAIAASTVNAAEWVLVTPRLNGGAISVDKQSIATEQGLKKAWVRHSFAVGMNGSTVPLINEGETKPSPPKAYKSDITQYWFECSTRKYALGKSVSYAGYDGKGDIVEVFTPPWTITSHLDDAFPDSPGEKILNVVCFAKR